MKENILKINTKLSEYIIKDILNKDINDWNNYQLLKEFILQINKSKGIFKYITEKDMIVISKDYNKEIFGYKSLWNILMKTNNKDIKNDVCNFLKSIYLGIKFSNIKEYMNFWENLTNNISESFYKLKPNDKADNNSIKGLISLISKIYDDTNKNGQIINNQRIINKLFEQLKNNKT